MTRLNHLLFVLAEECAEVAQRASKAARFGLTEVQPGRSLTNAERIVQETNDLLGVIEMLYDEGAIPKPGDRAAIDAKKEKVEKFLRYSKQCGTLT